MNFLTFSVFCCAFFVFSSATIFEQNRVKRQWGNWGAQRMNMNKFNNRNHIKADAKKYNCETQGISIIGLPISSFRCQQSGASARLATQQSGMQQWGGFFNNFMG